MTTVEGLRVGDVFIDSMKRVCQVEKKSQGRAKIRILWFLAESVFKDLNNKGDVREVSLGMEVEKVLGRAKTIKETNNDT